MPVADFRPSVGVTTACPCSPPAGSTACRTIFAPHFVDRAHEEGLAVILDVVYNHFGNVDNYLYEFADNFKSTCHQTEWADAINFDGENCQAVREFFATNARYWIDEFHLDGFRYDATQSIFDDSQPHILAVCNQAARDAAAAGGGRIFFGGGKRA